MKNLFGMMPSNSVDITKSFKDSNGLRITIEAGTNGWSILWADYSADCAADLDTPENNFKKAYDAAVEAVGPLRLA